MKFRSVRLAFFLILAATLAAAGHQFLTLERQKDAERSAARAFDGHARAVLAGLADLKAAQRAYVAAGQNERYWTTRVDTLIRQLRGMLAALEAAAEPAAGAARTAAASVESFARMDARARDLIRSDQRLAASDLIFADGLELLAAAGAPIDEARADRTVREQEALAALAQTQVWLLGGAALLALLIALPLVPRVTVTPAAAGPEAVAAEGTAPHAGESADAIGGLSLGDRPAADPAGLPQTGERETPDTGVDLTATAALCADLSRVTAFGELPVLLERAARLLDASGVVVWLRDGPAQALRPVLAHGYNAQAVARMGTIPRDSSNATATAYREGRLQTVKGNAFLGGALVAPLVTPAGCVGVMAAEVRNGREAAPPVQALAGIVAAQLAGIVTVEPAAGGNQQQAGRSASSV